GRRHVCDGREACPRGWLGRRGASRNARLSVHPVLELGNQRSAWTGMAAASGTAHDFCRTAERRTGGRWGATFCWARKATRSISRMPSIRGGTPAMGSLQRKWRRHALYSFGALLVVIQLNRPNEWYPVPQGGTGCPNRLHFVRSLGANSESS